MSRSDQSGKAGEHREPSKAGKPPGRPAQEIEATLSNAEDLPDLPELPEGEMDATMPLGTNAQVGSGTRGQNTEGPDGEETLPPSNPTPAPSLVPARSAAEQPVTRKSKGGMGATGDIFANRFVLEELLGEGGMGRVYLARDQFVDGRQVALKVLHPKFSKHETFRTLFFREIKTAQGFVSEHVNQVRDTGQTEDGTLFLTMDLVNGEDLDGLLKRESQVNVRHALDITIQLLKALQSGHEKGFVHRDVKPSNVMLANRIAKDDANPYGVGVRLLDFGIAGLAADMEEGKMVGTPNYMSPEQVQGHRLDARSDIFAVGVVLFEMITGTRPFQGKTLAQITSSILEKDMTPMIRDISNLSKPLQAILSKALEKNRDKRFQSAEQFITAIEKSSAYKLPSLMPAWAAVALVLMTLGTGAGGYFSWTFLQESKNFERQVNTAGITGVRDDTAQLTKFTEDLAAKQATIDAMLLAESKQKIAMDALREELRVERARLEADLNTGQDLAIDQTDLKAENRTLAQTVADMDREIKRISADMEARSREADRLASELADTRKQLAEFNAYEESNRPSALVADAFDNRLMEFWQARKGTKAEADLMSLRSNSNVGIIAGDAFLDWVTNLTLQLERHALNPGASQEQRNIREDAINELARLIPKAADLSDFQVQASKWLRLGEKDLAEGQASKRFQELSALINGPAGLVAEAEALIRESKQAQVDRWKQISAGDALQSPAAVIAMAREFNDDGFLEQELRRFALGLPYQLVKAGALNRTKLKQLASLDEWSALLAQRPALGEAEQRRELGLFQFAKNWFSDSNFVGARADAELFGPGPLAGKLDWAASLYLAHQMTLPDCAFPVPRNGRLVYRISRGADDEVFWRIHTLTSFDDSGDNPSWTVGLRSVEHDGLSILSSSSFDYMRVGKAFLNGSKEVLQLGGDNPAQAQVIQLNTKELPPLQLVKAAELGKFSSEIKNNSLLCLYQKDLDGVERWFSPTYGLVRELDTSKAKVIDLVFGNYAR